MHGSSYILKASVRHEFNKTSGLITLSMFFALVVSAFANIYPLYYFDDLEILPVKQSKSQAIQVVLVPTQEIPIINKPKLSASVDQVKPQPSTTSTSILSASSSINTLVKNKSHQNPNPASRNTGLQNRPIQHKKLFNSINSKPTKISSMARNQKIRKSTVGGTANKLSKFNAMSNLPASTTGISSKSNKMIANKSLSKTIPARKTATNGVQPLYKLTTMPAFAHKERPTYPELERKLGSESVVIAAATIDSKGVVKQVQIVQTGGSNFDRAVISALYKSSFYPAYIDNLAVATKLQIPYEFELK